MLSHDLKQNTSKFANRYLNNGLAAGVAGDQGTAKDGYER